MRLMARDQVVFLTGGASGIGRGLATRYRARGARCVLADVDEARVRETAKVLGCDGLVLDVRDVAQVEEAMARVRAEHGPIDVLVNSAGIGRAGETHLLAYDDWKQVLDVNLYGVVHCVRAVYPDMVERRSGHIVNIASIAGLFPSAGQVSYVASKFGVVGLSHALRPEAACHGVKVSVACPGVIDTPMTQGLPVTARNAERVRKLIPRGLDVDTCCDTILRGIDRNDATILVGGMARSLNALQRISPALAEVVNHVGVRWLTR